jgi:hypothetical protein
MKLPAPRGWLAVTAGVVTVLVLLTLPAPRRPAGGAGTAGTAAGPATLSTVWPAAHPFDLPATLPGGSTYAPILILDPATSVGLATSADGTDASLVVLDGRGVRVLQTHSVTNGGSYDGVTVAAGRLFWMHSVGNADGLADASLWSAPVSGGPATMLTADVGQPLFYGSQYDLVPADGRIYWTSANPYRPNSTELRSIAATGGSVGTQPLDGPWMLSSWPWLVTAPSAVGAPLRFMNVQTAAITPITVPANKLVTCDHTWCRILPDDGIRDEGVDLVRPDGSDRQHVGDKDSNPIAGDPALLDRFEPLLTTVSTTLAGTPVSQFSLYDTGRRGLVRIAPAVSRAGCQGDYVWWATGDNETLAWHGLDLHTLH